MSRKIGKDSARDPQRFLIVRHGESVANLNGTLAGRIDPTPLTSRGRAAARGLAEVLANFKPELILVSPLLRCRETIENAGIRDYRIEERLIEMDYGRWSGRKLARLSKDSKWPQIQKEPQTFTFPGGESFSDAWDRLRDLKAEINQRRERHIALISHGDISRMMITALLGRPLQSFQRILIEPASHSLLIEDPNSDGAHGATVGYLNRVPGSEAKSPSPGRRTTPARHGYMPGGE